MVQIYDEYDYTINDSHFSSYRKNLGNKLFIYAASRIISDLLNCDLISPENAIIRKELNSTKEYHEQKFPFGSVIRGNKITKNVVDVDDHGLIKYGSIQNLIGSHPDSGFIIKSYFSKYDYIKPYKEMVRSYFESITLPKRNDGSLVLMLRDSHLDRSFKLPKSYYLDLISKIKFNKLYISFDHEIMHLDLLQELKKYNPTIIDGDILTVFKEITSFDTIVACQGTFSFWVSFLSNADKVYWPITADGPNSGINSKTEVIKTYVNLLVDDEDRYEHITVL
jgi:hypothetical protein